MIGKKFGRLTVLKDTLERKNKHPIYKCICDCGNIVYVKGCHLRSGHTKSSGCLRHEKYNLKHGKRYTRLYKIWLNIKQRCNNLNNPRYKDYGGRGITICDEWLNDFMAFYNWSVKNGYRDNLTIDRIDNNKGYSPLNCRWATINEQANNTRSNVYLTYDGKTQTMKEWVNELNVPYGTIKQRHRKGWTDKECLFGK